MASSPRVGVIGARRRRQGLGPFVVRDLRAAGARVPCFVTTEQTTLEAARRQLAERDGVDARGYLDLDAMLAREALDALAILCPAETHGAYLEAALAAGLHVLCEKPLLWGRSDLDEASARIASGFDAKGLLLWENCQWPYTLPAYRRLHPDALESPPRRFEMHLQPATGGLRGLGESLPHALSLLQAVVPGADPRVEQTRFTAGEAASPALSVSFRYRTSAADVHVLVRLEPSSMSPTAALLAFNGRVARRVVAREDYRLSFVADDRTVPMADPLTLLVAEFVSELAGGRVDPGASRSREIAERMRLLAALVAAYRQWGAQP